MAHLMPFCKEKSAPIIIDEANPGQELFRYITDLEQLFTCHRVTTDDEKKKWFIYYPGIDIAKFWESLPEYSSGQTYTKFKTAVTKHYPDADPDWKYDCQDLDHIIGQYAGEVDSLAELAAYYRDFYPKAKHLVAKNRLSIYETSRLFSKGFTPHVWDSIIHHLQIKLPDHHPADPYDVSKIHSAAQFILQGTNKHSSHKNSPLSYRDGVAMPTRPSDPYPSSIAIPIPSTTVDIEQTEPQVKLEHINGLIKLSETLLQLHADRHLQQAAQASHKVFAQSHSIRSCQFCGKPGHQFCDCHQIEIMEKAGKCCWNHENKIVLPTGAYIPHNLPGTCLQDRINAWHRQLDIKPVSAAIQEPIPSPNPTSSPIYVPTPVSTSQQVPSTPLLPPGLSKPQPPVPDVAVPDKKQHLKELLARSQAITTEIQRLQSDMNVPLPDDAVTPIVPEMVATEIKDPEMASTMKLDEVTHLETVPHIPISYAPSIHSDEPVITPKSAPESVLICAIHPIVNHQFKVECIVDSGSQIVSMLEATCHRLGLAYDQSTTIEMQAANNTINRSLGLAHNVPLLIGDITLHLQIHVFRESGPHILLGRPFDILTQSMIRNYANGSQIISIHDPNTGKTAIIPTVPGGLGPAPSHYKSSRKSHHQARRKKKQK
ncbi:hypothetical protein ARMGADRAFT_1131661 [Armillaria gallica]|uniref:CCHC-type domain-containing protein n=1 Tax=Armillaria gallica TaxID=47427 RepID=A0A2H3CTP6_ARMGA|nr:hypothetical protein ARMGADRAFT_1131661 [Armillaria gallica]